jgi:hypothetical protein
MKNETKSKKEQAGKQIGLIRPIGLIVPWEQPRIYSITVLLFTVPVLSWEL